MLRRPFILSALAVTALLALAASAAHTRPLSAAGARSGSLPSSLVDYSLTTLVIVGAIICVMFARFFPAALDLPESRPFPVRVLRTVGILLVAVGLIALIVRHTDLANLLHHAATPRQHARGGGAGGGENGVPTGSSRTVTFRWDELIALAGLGLIAAAVVYTRRQRATVGWTNDRGEQLAGAISVSLDDLRSDPDLRRAIVAAYARMEGALAASGVPRNPAEAPREYLERALLSVHASASAARRLTGLFERAKFSHHEPDSRMRDEAIEALVAIRDELRLSSEVAA